MEGLGELVILELALMVFINVGRASYPKIGEEAFIVLGKIWPLKGYGCPAWGPASDLHAGQSGKPAWGLA